MQLLDLLRAAAQPAGAAFLLCFVILLAVAWDLAFRADRPAGDFARGCAVFVAAMVLWGLALSLVGTGA